MKNNKVDYYYDKIMEARKCYEREHQENSIFPERPSGEKDEMKYALSEIINNNFEYFLTASFLDYLGSMYDPCSFLKSIAISYKERMKMFVWYLYGLVNSIDDSLRDKNKVIRYLDLLDDNTKMAAIYINDRINENGGRANSDLHILLLNLFSYCYINNMLDKLERLCEIIIKDPNRINDDFLINNIRYGTEAWYDRLSVFIDDYCNNTRVII